METIKAQMDGEKAARVRTAAVQIYGAKKGALSSALNDAIDEWLSRIETKRKGNAPNFRKFAGVLEMKINSVKLQHKLTRIRAKG